MADEQIQRKELLGVEVGAGVVLALGRDLISGSVQAVVELVKNAFDADSPLADVRVDTRAVATEPSFDEAVGFVRVTDAGHGMTLDDVRRGWLSIAHSRKRKMKKDGRRTAKYGRTPLGDKGLGRLGAQALGRYVEIVSRAAGSPDEIRVCIDWESFARDIYLSEVEVDCFVTPRADGAPDGTVVTIWGLKKLDEWANGKNQRLLQTELSQLISPFYEVKDFSVYLSVDGFVFDLLKFGKVVREAAATTFEFSFDGELLVVDGYAKLRYCQPMGKNKRERVHNERMYSSYVSGDSGTALFEYLSQCGAVTRNKTLEIQPSDREGWYVWGRTVYRFEDFDKVELDDDGVSISPGPFNGALDTFVFGSTSKLSVSKDVRGAIDEHVGVRVYRDGFGIKLHDDWLGLAKLSTRGKSFFQLKAYNTLGFVAISAAENSQLEETADRQRFQENLPAFKNFRSLIEEVVKFAGVFQTLLKDATLEYFRLKDAENGGVSPLDSNDDIKARFDSLLEDASSAKGRVTNQLDSLLRIQNRVAQYVRSVPATSDESESVVERPQGVVAGDEFEALQKDIVTVVEASQESLRAIDGLISQTRSVVAASKVLSDRIDALNAQAVLLYETASLGMSAEMISHEIAQISQGLRTRATKLVKSLRKEGADRALISFVEHVRSQAAALRLQASHVAPALRYVREHRSRVGVGELVSDIAGYHRERLARNDIEIDVVVPEGEDFVVHMNQGRLTQVLDNLIANSEYWVTEKLRREKTAEGAIIRLWVGRPFIRVTDSGGGVDPAVEGLLFEQPFVTRKKEGRGLGLFISSQLLDSAGCTIALSKERNQQGRLTTFEIDLSGAINGD